MAVNNDPPEHRKTYGPQPGNSGAYEQESNGLLRTRTASPENGRASPTIFNPYYTGRPRTPASGSKSGTIDRLEIIRRIKSGGSRPTSPEIEKPATTDRQDFLWRIKNEESRPLSSDSERVSSDEYGRRRLSPTSRPSTPTSQDSWAKMAETQQDNQSIGMQIERPRSALHRGDFRERAPPQSPLGQFSPQAQEPSVPSLSTSPVVPWHPEFPSAALRQSREINGPTAPRKSIPIPQRPVRDRAVSNSSLAASFAYRPPTSPLVQSSRPDTPDPPLHLTSPSPDKSRRHTFSPQSFKRFRSSVEYTSSAAPPLRPEKSFPYQAHQPRRSLNTASFSSLPHTPASVFRRPSFSTESPLHHAPMVGSYEESILRGRMSTIPSRPLNFMAQIGVLGKGNCKPNLRCPSHVSVPFPAVFYSYGSGSKNPVNDQPSPYVGLIDLENNLSNQEDVHEKRRHKLHGNMSRVEHDRASSTREMLDDEAASDPQARRRKRQKAKRRSTSPKAPPGGSYRIPAQGQLQIVIKNPNKTAVKLFLVPYDVSDMEPGQKTFIRQRSYSAGPIIDMPLASRKNLGTDRPEAALNATGDPDDKPVLRYLIHLHICCPSKGRYFLYKSIRVVFANRVPDGKERLRNEIQLPEPRYSAYKSGKDFHAISGSGSGGTAWTKELNSKRPNAFKSDQIHDSHWSQQAPPQMTSSLPWHEYSSQYDIPMHALSYHDVALPTVESRPTSRQLSDDMDLSVSPGTDSVRSPISSDGDHTRLSTTRNLEDPFVWQRERSREQHRPGSRNESLLSKRLMDLAFQRQGNSAPGEGG